MAAACWDCSTRTGVHPVLVNQAGVVQRVCQLCWNRHWSKWLHPTGCTCERCDALRRQLL